MADPAGDVPVVFRVGRCAVDPARGLLLREGHPVHLTRKAFQALLLLLRQRHRVVEKDELIGALWPDTVVEENNLAQHISALRKALGHSAASPSIATVSGRGYRFVAPVEEVHEPAPNVAGASGNGRAIPEGAQLAILPFQWLPPAPEAEHLGLALADALITRLSRIPHVRIRSTSAIRGYAAGLQDCAGIGEALGVQLLLQGTLQRAGRRTRVRPQLVGTGDLSVLWADTIEVPALDVLDAEDRIADAAARAIGGSLPPRRTALAGIRAGARDAYLRGRYCLSRDGAGWLEKAVDHFRRALALEPDFAAAHAGLAQAHATLGFGYAGTDPEPHFRLASRHAWQALSLDEHQGEAHAVLGQVAYLHDWDWATAGREFDRALALEPDAVEVRHWRSQYLVVVGRTAEALEDIRHALARDPLSVQLNMHLGLTLLSAGQLEAAVTQFQDTLHLAPDSGGTHALLGWVYEEQGRYEEALAEMREAARLDPHPSWRLAAIAHVHALAGRREDAAALLEQLLEMGRTTFVSPTCLAEIYVALGDHARALEWLGRAVDVRDPFAVYSAMSSRLAPLRPHPAFGAIIDRLGLPAARPGGG